MTKNILAGFANSLTDWARADIAKRLAVALKRREQTLEALGHAQREDHAAFLEVNAAIAARNADQRR